jgi:hypothetical protein
MGLENLEELIRRKIIGKTVEVEFLGDTFDYIVITDDRVPEGWLWETFCTICTPRGFWREQEHAYIQSQMDRGVKFITITVEPV